MLQTARDFIEAAYALQREGRFNEAKEIYDRLLAHIDEPDPNVLLAYAYIQIDQGNKGLACYLLREALKRGFDTHPIAWSNLGLCYFEMGRELAAKECFSKAIACDPNCVEALANMSGWHINKDMAAEAEHYARRAVQVNPKHPQSHAHLAQALLEQGKFDEAWEHFRWRWDTPEMVKNKRPYKAPYWNGTDEVIKLAIHGEQGVGDEAPAGVVEGMVGAKYASCTKWLVLGAAVAWFWKRKKRSA